MLRELEIVSEIIREAGAIVLKHYEAGTTADEKKGGEPVTAADRESDAFIVGALRKAFPDDEIVSEESIGGLVGSAANQPAGARDEDAQGDDAFVLEFTPDAKSPSVDHVPPRVWYVDPMDGTSDFVKRTGDFVVMIGLAIAGWPVLGVVYHPITDTLYRGGHGIPAEKVVGGGERTDAQSGGGDSGTSTARGDAEPVEMRVSETEDPAEARLVVSRSHTPEIIADLAEKLGITQMEKCGSVGLKAARVAEGIGDLYLHPSVGTKLWDTCAPEAILVAAGGTFTDCDGKPIVYESSRLHNERGVFASNGRLHDSVIEVLRDSYR